VAAKKSDLSKGTALIKIAVETLESFDDEGRKRWVVESIAAAIGLQGLGLKGGTASGGQSVDTDGRDNGELGTPAQYIARKRPLSDIERIACLAKYLADARGVNAFKTKDLTSLNTEARQASIQNPSMAVDNATKAHFLAPIGRQGMKQLIQLGSDVVDALPNRDEVKRLRDAYAETRRGGRRRTTLKKVARGKAAVKTRP